MHLRLVGAVLFVISAVVLSVVVSSIAAFNWAFPKPDLLTKQTAGTLVRYPNANSWDIFEVRGSRLCYDTCSAPEVMIEFKSKDTWRSVYEFYNHQLPFSDWKFYSGPFSDFIDEGSTLVDNPGPYKEGEVHLITYRHKNKCKARLSNFFNGKSANEKPDQGEFSIVVECPQEYVIGSDK